VTARSDHRVTGRPTDGVIRCSDHRLMLGVVLSARRTITYSSNEDTVFESRRYHTVNTQPFRGGREVASSSPGWRGGAAYVFGLIATRTSKLGMGEASDGKRATPYVTPFGLMRRMTSWSRLPLSV